MFGLLFIELNQSQILYYAAIPNEGVPDGMDLQKLPPTDVAGWLKRSDEQHWHIVISGPGVLISKQIVQSDRRMIHQKWVFNRDTFYSTVSTEKYLRALLPIFQSCIKIGGIWLSELAAVKNLNFTDKVYSPGFEFQLTSDDKLSIQKTPEKNLVVGLSSLWDGVEEISKRNYQSSPNVENTLMVRGIFGIHTWFAWSYKNRKRLGLYLFLVASIVSILSYRQHVRQSAMAMSSLTLENQQRNQSKEQLRIGSAYNHLSAFPLDDSQLLSERIIKVLNQAPITLNVNRVLLNPKYDKTSQVPSHTNHSELQSLLLVEGDFTVLYDLMNWRENILKLEYVTSSEVKELSTRNHARGFQLLIRYKQPR